MKVEANGKTFEFPDGTSGEDIGAAIDEYFAGKVKPSLPRGVVTEFAQGASFGFADEGRAMVEAGLDAMLPDTGMEKPPFHERYKQHMENIAKERGEFKEEYPKTAIASEIVGGVTTGIGGGGKVAAMHGVKAMSPAMKFAIPSATGGTLYGAGSAKPGDRTEGAIIGGTVGGVIGIGSPYVGALVKRAAGKITRPIWDSFTKTFQSADTQAKKAIIKALQNGNANQKQVAQRLKELGPDATLAEGDDALLNLADNVVNSPGESSKIARTVMGARQRQGAAQDRIITKLKKVTGVEGKYLDDYLSLDATRKASAAPLYKKAHSQQIEMTPTLEKILKTKTGQRAFKQARAIVADELDGQPLTRVVGEDGVEEIIPDVRTWDYIKRGLDDIISDNTGEFGKMNSKAYRANQLRKALLKELDEVSPDYAAARKAYAGPTANMDAMKMGTKILKEDADITALSLSKMSASEKEAYLVGATKALKDAIYSAGENANAANKILNNSLRVQRLRPLFKSDKEYKGFISMLRKESLFKQTENTFGGSRTFARQMQDAESGIPNSRADVVANAIKEVLSPDMSPQVRNAIGKMLFSQGDDALKIIQNMKVPQGQGPLLPEYLAPASGMFTGGQAGSGAAGLFGYK